LESLVLSERNEVMIELDSKLAVKVELAKLLGDDNMWGAFAKHIAMMQNSTALDRCLGHKRDEFVALLVAVGMLRDELMAWCKA
jgi:hypothetical protein